MQNAYRSQTSVFTLKLKMKFLSFFSTIFHKSCDLFYSPNKVRTFSFFWQPQVLLYKMNVDFLGHKQEQSLLLLFSLVLSLSQLNPLSHDDERILIESPCFHPFLVISRSTAIVKTVSQIEITTNSCKLNIFLFFIFFFFIFKFQAVYFYFLWGMNLQCRRVNSFTKRQRARSLKKKLKHSYALKVLHPTETISSSLRLSIIIAWCASCQVRE